MATINSLIELSTVYARQLEVGQYHIVAPGSE